ncbi:TPA: hypothetical protein ACG3ND_001559 [Staphylococcus aureus]|uniref:hypothetical protein n=1 Tax=Staphylococcus aureus TaxID=1280 RepID=UPI000D659A8F|nr:hypothetical protein [Staphylococcus aureus]MBH4765529.1 hypothetical protein [Staphylococcus aureus]MBH4798884.1 hypothetical protein [Staphylococcus aureus]MBH4801574.1 hypothetical protein [Staphylococcus aureus]MBH4806232.1 hypothetical protein [Staphylococcus aureus]MBH4821852.1 hypothetical protein [Staphylococcus aureus]
MSQLKIYDLKEIEQLTLTEYYYRMWAKEYERLDQIQQMFDLAFSIRNAQLTENVGTENKPEEKYMFNDTSDLLDYEENVKRLDEGLPIEFKERTKDIESAMTLKEKLSLIAQVNKNANERSEVNG